MPLGLLKTERGQRAGDWQSGNSFSPPAHKCPWTMNMSWISSSLIEAGLMATTKVQAEVRMRKIG
ncbi:hypothetical protein JMJ77_0015163 [Colletotrichum scovillei]|uniref:Uncharacterized protein n=1 Tax=Colletotrichum scovillei TaxID=1209932 RepID=A0A9P7UA82_9PEZI|nr:hypothetical protein JMJ77_0015163 [Colletotrichum scovillei]KAG7056789.1 hypothetical protein JMJ78_0000579 [Colletotrichum scovillei]KAG7066713.1 hypothetical protein JMJ76_0000565 [Colletotrichum scovillei]